MTKLNRVSLDICLHGGKGKGKSQAETYYLFRHYINGGLVASNMDLFFPIYPGTYKPIKLDSMEKIRNIYNALIVLVDLERCLSSRRWKSKENEEVMEIILNWGKRRNSLIWSAKRPQNVDNLLRDTTDYWGECSLVPNFKALNIDDFDNRASDNKNLLVKIDFIDFNGNELHTQYIGNLELYCKFYSTYEEISQLRTENNYR